MKIWTTRRRIRKIARKKSLNGFWSRRSIFSNLLAVWDVSLTGVTEFEAEDVAEAIDRKRWAAKSSNLVKPWSSHPRAGLRSLGVPISAQPPSKSFLWGPEWWLDFGCEFWGDFWKMHGSAVWRLLQKIRKNPHPKSAHPVERSAPISAPKIRTKIRTQNPHQHARPKLSINTHRDPQRKGHKGCPLSYTFLLLAQVPKNPKKSHQKSVTRLRGKLDGKKKDPKKDRNVSKTF